jgi:anaerobic selenocysteine-containing dehydrogenase
MLQRAGQGALDGLYCIGGNFLETLPQPERVRAALETIPLRVHTDIVPSSQMLVEPADTVFVLPSRTRYEQRDGGTETTTERRVIYSPEIPGRRIGEATSEWELLLRFGQAVRPELSDKLAFADGAAIRADIAAAIPAYEPIAGLARQGDAFQWGGPRLCADRSFPTSDGKARFRPVRPPGLPATGEEPAADDGSFVLATRRGKQFNSMVQNRRDPLTGAERDHVLVHPADLARLGLGRDDPVLLTSADGHYLARAFPADVARGTVQGHWPEVNVLLPPERVEPEAGVPDYNARVTLRAACGPAEARARSGTGSPGGPAADGAAP